MKLLDRRDKRYPHGIAIIDLPVPEKGNKLYYDDDVKGFACRVTAAGSRAFVLNYHFRGRERRYAIGRHPDWSVAAARQKARELKRCIADGHDPVAARTSHREAPTVADLIDRFKEEHLPAKRPATKRDYADYLDKMVRPALGNHKVAEIVHADIDKLHREISRRAPYRANRMAAVLSKAFSLAIRWGWRTDNPVKGLDRNQEEKRNRYLSPEELIYLGHALNQHHDQQSANAIRLLLLSGARRMEVLAATWDMFDLEQGIWTKPSAHTKQRKEHRVPLSAPARLLLVEMKRTRLGSCPYVFPGHQGAPHLVNLKRTWAAITQHATALLWAAQTDTDAGRLAQALTVTEAGKVVIPTYKDLQHAAAAAAVALPPGLTDCRIHDLRHTYAAILASAGVSLHVIGALLGHTQPITTARYAHLRDDPLRAATEHAGSIITANSQSADLVSLSLGADRPTPTGS